MILGMVPRNKPVNCLQGSRGRKIRLKGLKDIRGLRGWEVLETVYCELFSDKKYVLHLEIYQFRGIQY